MGLESARDQREEETEEHNYWLNIIYEHLYHHYQLFVYIFQLLLFTLLHNFAIDKAW